MKEKVFLSIVVIAYGKHVSQLGSSLIGILRILFSLHFSLLRSFNIVKKTNKEEEMKEICVQVN